LKNKKGLGLNTIQKIEQVLKHFDPDETLMELARSMDAGAVWEDAVDMVYEATVRKMEFDEGVH